jgi:UV DNA damage endonuclease
MSQNIGYACISSLLKENSTNRTVRLKTYQTHGLPLVSKLALQNVKDLVALIKHNEKHNIKFFRMSSNIFPWQSTYELEELPDYNEIFNVLKQASNLIKKYNHRITAHPGQFNVLASPKKEVVTRTIRDLRDHAIVMDLLELSQTPFNKINIHVGGAYGDKDTAIKTWCDNFQLLPTNVKSRLTIENDDKAASFSTKDLMYIHENCGIPIVFDYHHHTFNTGGLSEGEAFLLAYSTWKNIKPVCHVSEPRDSQKPRSHHDYIFKEVYTYEKDVDLMFECKQKDAAVLKYRELYLSK